MKKIITAFLVTVTLTFSGCSTIGSVVEYGKDNQATAYVTVQYSTAKVIKGDEDRALAVLEHVEDARSFVESGAEVSISNLVEGVKEEINWGGMKPEDRMLVELLLIQAQKDLEVRVGEGVLEEDQVVVIETLLDWIEQGANTYLEQ